MSDSETPEDSVKNALHKRIGRLLRGKEEVETVKRTLRDAERNVAAVEAEARRYHQGLIHLVTSTEPDFDRYVRSFTKANPR